MAKRTKERTTRKREAPTPAPTLAERRAALALDTLLASLTDAADLQLRDEAETLRALHVARQPEVDRGKADRFLRELAKASRAYLEQADPKARLAHDPVARIGARPRQANEAAAEFLLRCLVLARCTPLHERPEDAASALHEAVLYLLPAHATAVLRPDGRAACRPDCDVCTRIKGEVVKATSRGARVDEEALARAALRGVGLPKSTVDNLVHTGATKLLEPPFASAAAAVKRVSTTA